MLARLEDLNSSSILDPADVEEASQRPLVLAPTSPPMSATAQEEEISLLLGTLQVGTSLSCLKQKSTHLLRVPDSGSALACF